MILQFFSAALYIILFTRLSLSLSLYLTLSFSLCHPHSHTLYVSHSHSHTFSNDRNEIKIQNCPQMFIQLFFSQRLFYQKKFAKKIFFLRISSILKNIFFLKWRKLNEDLEILILEPHNLLSPTINSVFMEGGKCPGKKWWVWVSWVQIHDRDFFFKKSLLKHAFVIILVFIFDCPITLHLAWARFWGRHSTEVAFALLTQQPRVWILAQPWFYYTA